MLKDERISLSDKHSTNIDVDSPTRQDVVNNNDTRPNMLDVEDMIILAPADNTSDVKITNELNVSFLTEFTIGKLATPAPDILVFIRKIARL